jgi:hypothetical protein
MEQPPILKLKKNSEDQLVLVLWYLIDFRRYDCLCSHICACPRTSFSAVLSVLLPSSSMQKRVLLPSSPMQKRKWSDSERESDNPITNIGRKHSEWQSKNIISTDKTALKEVRLPTTNSRTFQGKITL